MTKIKQRFFVLAFVCAVTISCAPQNKDPDVGYPKSNIKYTDSFETIKAAADAGDPKAMYILVDLVTFRDRLTKEEVKSYLLKSAEKKYPDAQERLMHSYEDGYLGFPVDYKKSIYWAQRSTCDHHGEHLHLAAIYGPNDVQLSKIVAKQEKAFAKENLPLAYAHLRMAPKSFVFSETSDEKEFRERMTPEQIAQSDQIYQQLKNGGCPYGN